MDLSSNFIAILGVVALVLLFNLWRRKNKSRKGVPLLPPQVSGWLPIIGHLGQLRGKKHLARILGDIADKYGPIFMIWLGNQRTIVISDAEILKEFYTTYDRCFLSRPQISAGKFLGYDYAAFGLAPYGPYWRNVRKLTMMELLSNHRLRLLKHVQSSEVTHFINDLFFKSNQNGNNALKVDMGEMFMNLVLNMTTRMVAGKRYLHYHNDEEKKGRHAGEIIRDFMDLAGAFVPSDLFPFLGWTESFGVVQRMKKIMKEMDDIVETWVQEHELKNDPNTTKDFIDVLLSTVKDDSTFGKPRRTVIKATAMVIILGGSETTSVTLTWLVANLLDNRRVLLLAQEEMDQKVGRERIIEEADMEKLVYLDAIIKETLRLFRGGPLAIPRESIEDCVLYGYHIPKGTRILTNFHKLHRNPNVWKNPEEFKPERFLTTNANLDYLGQRCEYLPFGSGRRSCPGSNFAIQVMQLTVGRLIQAFNLTTPNNEPVDMTESLHVSFSKETPLHVMLTPRLAPQFYQH